MESDRAPIEDTIKYLCEAKGDDLSDFAFLTVEDSLVRHASNQIIFRKEQESLLAHKISARLIPQQAGILDEGTSNQSPHASLTATLL